MTATLERVSLAAMTDDELSEAFAADMITLGQLETECDRRDKANKIRASSRERNGTWEAAAYANYLAADADTRGNLLSEAGRRTGREPWPMLWEGSEERARRYASEDLERFWDYVTPRPPGPGEYAAAEREAAAEQRERANAPTPGMLAAIAAARGEPAPGSIARTITALGALTRTLDRTAASAAAANGRIQR